MESPRHFRANEMQPLGRRERKAQATRRALIEAGLRAVERHPIAMVSVLDITDGADAAKGVFYLHFASKDDYLLAICEELYRGIIDDVRIESRSMTKPAARLEAVVDAYHRLGANKHAAFVFLCRMNSYLADEIGPPGKLKALRSNYLCEIAGILVSRAPGNVSTAAWRRARLVDGICTDMYWQALRVGYPLPTRQELLQVVAAAVGAMQR